uniref:Synembryn-A n=1 Tax=Ciona savignyi TaxID=51511 RepID=H2YH28_CIOSA
MDQDQIDEQALIAALSLDDQEKTLTVFTMYNQSKKDNFNLSPENSANRQALAKKMLQILMPSSKVMYLAEALSTFLYLSRDRELVLRHMSAMDFINFFLKHGKLTGKERPSKKDSDGNDESRTELLASTALNSKCRTKLVENYGGRTVLMEFLRCRINMATESNSNRKGKMFTKHQAELVNEALKVLFNVNVDLRKSTIYSAQEVADLDLAVSSSKTILLSTSENDAMTESLHCNAGNALYSVPPQQLNMDLFIEKSGDCSSMETIKSDGMAPLLSLFNILHRYIMNNTIKTDILQPLLALLCQLCRLSAVIRKAFKAEILPPRKDLKRRPEEGGTLSNKMIKLCTHTNVEVKHGVADFLFVLCKEDVDRFVKYTGYGNAAGLLAARGLLAGGHGETVYSESDSDSDTEEYINASSFINPVTGHVPPPSRNPMEGMTDEQKEYLAVQLANDISKLSSHDVIQPMCVGEDGQLIPFRQKVHETQLEENEEESV